MMRSREPKNVLFLCVENANRSQMAEAFGRLYAPENVSVYSAGSRPAGEINAKATASMKEIGCEITAQRSKALSEVPNVEYDVIVSMGCGDACPQLRAKVRQDWEIPDPRGYSPEEFRTVRELIASKVKVLMDGL